MRSVFTVSVPILATAVSAANGVCDQAQYSLLSCLENDDAASQECSSRMPVYTSTETAKQAASGYQVTVTVTDQDVRTTYVTSTVSADFTVTTITSIGNTSTTTYIPATPVTTPASRKRALQRKRASSCDTDGALSALSSLAEENFATACSCIGNAAPTVLVTVTPTLAPTEAVRATTTVHQGATVTSTITAAASAETLTQTVSSVATATATVDSPSYTHVFGPKAGCQDTGDIASHQLPTNITDGAVAARMCQDFCSQEGNCEFVYVQWMFSDYGTVTPMYECFLQGHVLDEEKDLLCGLKEGIWGMAEGFNAVGRGPASGLR